MLQTQGKLAEAEPFSREAFETLRHAVGEEHPDTLTAMGNLGDLYTDGDSEEQSLVFVMTPERWRTVDYGKLGDS